MAHTISVIYGSVRSQREGIYAAEYLRNKVTERGHIVHFIDPLKYRFPLLDKMYKEYNSGKAPEFMEEVAGMLNESDGFLVVTGEYNHSIPPALKNLLDHYQSEYLFKPSAIASYSAGRFAGMRSAVHLRVIMAELGAPSISSILPVSNVGESFDKNSNPLFDYIEEAADGFLTEFEWYIEALKNQRAKHGTPF